MKKFSQAQDGLSRFVARVWPVGLLAVAGVAHAGSPVPANINGVLADVVSSRLVGTDAAFAAQKSQARTAVADASGQAAVSIAADSLIRDASGRVLVSILLDPNRAAAARVKALVRAIRGINLTAEDLSYRGGILEGYVPESQLVALAKLPGVAAVHGQVRPNTNVGKTTSQGVQLHKIDQLPSTLNGSGITVGILSDSYNTTSTYYTSNPVYQTREADDIASCDLPGPGNPCGNTQPVVVLADLGTYPQTAGADEGRGMAQLIHDTAPKARLGFATAFAGEVDFANNIRALAGIQGLPNSRPDFAAQIIVDDVQYGDEGMFADTVVAQAVDDVTALGVTYFSSAGNTPPTQGYASDFRYVPVAGATAGSNINLANVPASLYAGGFHNFRSDGGQDIAQTITLGTSSTGAARVLQMMFQWDDPYDSTPPTVGSLVSTTPGSITTSTGTFDAPFNNPTAGAAFQVDVHGFATGSTTADTFDAVVTVIAPDGSTVETVDTGNGETFTFFTQQAGQYIVRVAGYSGATGNFTVAVNNVAGTQRVTTDFNLLFFRVSDGAYLGFFGENNLASNRPLEAPGIQFASGNSQVQMVIARGNMPTAPNPATRIRYKTNNGGTASYPAEYFSYSAPVTYGHNSAAGANGVAAYSPFRSNIPEDFTSTGPVRIVWDRNNNRIPEDQQVRLQPRMAAMDGGNTTFFTSDTNRDIDTFPNFFGTSAAAPTAASIAALVLQAHGGPGSVTPLQMRTILQNSAFPHDLDPYAAQATVNTVGASRGKVTVTLSGDNSTQARTDPNAFSVSYTGPSAITSITFDGTNANPNGGNVSVASTPGLVFDTRAAGQPFVVGSASVGLTAANVTATMLNQAPAPSVTGEYFGMKLDFASGSFIGGKTLRFGVGRDKFRSEFAPPTGTTIASNSADLAGAVTRLPEGTQATGGITFTGTLADGSTFSGTLTNRIGAGWTFLDGYGFIDATKAVALPLP